MGGDVIGAGAVSGASLSAEGLLDCSLLENGVEDGGLFGNGGLLGNGVEDVGLFGRDLVGHRLGDGLSDSNLLCGGLVCKLACTGILGRSGRLVGRSRVVGDLCGRGVGLVGVVAHVDCLLT